MTARRPLSRPTFRRHSFRPRLDALEGRIVLSASFGSVLGVGSDAAAILVYDNAVDAAGNTYVTGILNGTMDMDPNTVRPDGSDILPVKGSSDAFVAKYAPDNTLIWARRMGSDYVRSSNLNDPSEQGQSLAVDSSGNVYVTGEFVGRADFGAVTLVGTGTSTDTFVAKFNADGGVAWAKSWGTAATREFGTSIAVDAAGNVISAGFTATLSSNGAWKANGFEIRKYSPTGASVWSQRYSNNGGTADAMAVDPAGNIYVTGLFSGALDMNLASNKTNKITGSTVVTGGTGVNAYVLKLSASGAYQWASPFVAKSGEDSTSHVRFVDMSLDTSGNVVLCGDYYGQVDLNPSASIDLRLPAETRWNGLVVKLSSNGSLAWANRQGSSTIRGIDVDASGSIYTTGSFSGTFTPGAGLPTLSSNGQDDVYLTKMSAAGVIDWALSFGGVTSDGCYALEVDSAGKIHLAGIFNRTVDFDPDPASVRELTNSAYGDMFLLTLIQS